jgi:hypothetical protein
MKYRNGMAEQPSHPTKLVPVAPEYDMGWTLYCEQCKQVFGRWPEDGPPLSEADLQCPNGQTTE